MLNIIKNSFIMFYKYLPILLLLGLIGPVYSYLYPISNHPISTTLISGICSFIIFAILSNIKNLHYFKSWKLLVYYTIAYITIKAINYGTEQILFEYSFPKIARYINFLYTPVSYAILSIATTSYISFRLGIILCMIVNKESPTLKNIATITYAPYWKIFVFMTIIDLPNILIISQTHNPFIILGITWYGSCLSSSFIVNFYKNKKKGMI